MFNHLECFSKISVALHEGKLEQLWKIDDKDIEAAFIAMALPKPEDPRVEELKNMILDRFDNDIIKYYEWSLIIRKMVSEKL